MFSDLEVDFQGDVVVQKELIMLRDRHKALKGYSTTLGMVGR